MVDKELVPTLKCVEVVFEILLFYSSILIMTGFFLMMVVGGMRYLTSGGNPEKLKKAQATLRWGVVGTLIFASAFLILQIIDVLFLGGAGKLFKFEIPSFGPSTYTQPQPQPVGGSTTQSLPSASTGSDGTSIVLLLPPLPPRVAYAPNTTYRSTFGNPLPESLPPAIPQQQHARQEIASQFDRYLANKAVYQQAGQMTGVPWEILAAIHYREGSFDQKRSLISGTPLGQIEQDVVRARKCTSAKKEPGDPIPLGRTRTGELQCGFATLLDSAIYAGAWLRRGTKGNLDNFEHVAKALSRYNGMGNKNCDKNPGIRRSPYAGCPPYFEGEDHPYVLNFFDERHAKMYIMYSKDKKKDLTPKVDGRPGVLTVVRIIRELEKANI